MTAITPFRSLFLSIMLAIGALVMVQSEASAQQAYSITGTYRQWCCNWPNSPAFTAFLPTPIINSFPFAGGGGGLTIQSGFPGSGHYLIGHTDGALQFPASAVRGKGTFLNTDPGITGWRSIQTQVDFHNAAATLMPGGQVGVNQAYCLNWTGNPNCTDPAVGNYNGLMSYSEGPNQFGGTMTMLGGTPGWIWRTAGGGTSEYRYGPFAAPMNQIGNVFSNYQTETNTVVFTAAGEVATTTISSIPGYPKTLMDPIVFAGIPWGTGNVYAVMTGNSGFVNQQSFDYSGYDNRNVTSGGAVTTGNISLVAASFVRGPTTNGFPTVQSLMLQVPEPGQIAMLISGVGLLAMVGVRNRRS
jgi:hypothetical protein